MNQGGKTIELQPLSPEVFDAIPKQHFKEIQRLSKLTGAETTVHAPLIDPAGFTKEGWSEAAREQTEEQLKSIVERSHELDPEGNIPITIHASGIPGTEYSKPSKELIEDYKKMFQERYGREPTQEELRKLEESQVIAINKETGQLIPLKREEKYYPETGKVIRVPEQEIREVNNTEWINNITNLTFYKKEADEVIRNSQANLFPLFEKLEKGKQLREEELKRYQGAIENLKKADLFLDNVETSFRSLYNKAYKYGDEKTREELKQIAENWKKAAEEEKKLYQQISQGEANPLETLKFVIKKSQLIDDTLLRLKERLIHNPPKVYEKIEDFATKKSAETLGNVAFSAYKKYKNKAPIISIENLYPGMAFSRANELKNLVENARKEFIERAKKEGMSASEAEKAAEKLIGVTWDVGHINLLRKAGYSEEEIKKETEKIAPFVKHVHLTDNFGYGDTHLPPGMGNVPLKDILKELEKAGFKGKKIVEAGGFVQHFKTTPTPYILEALGSPLYTAMMQPYWNQIRSTYGNYFSYPLAYFPEQHFSIYGSSFSALPVELGGQMPGKQSRMTGTPTA